jgi:hypothetical protein
MMTSSIKLRATNCEAGLATSSMKSEAPTYFSISFSNEPTGMHYESLSSAIFEVYRMICLNKILYRNIQLTVHYELVPLTMFKFSYEKNHLVMYNNEDKIRISSIVPTATILDREINKEHGPSSNTQDIIKETVKETGLRGPLNFNTEALPQTPPIQSTKHIPTNNFLQKSIVAKKSIEKSVHDAKKKSKSSNVSDDEKLKQFDEKFEAKREEKRLDRIETMKHENKLRIFTDDKKIYPRIKDDIANGKLKYESIHPNFVAKYQIFKILEERSAIDFTHNLNIADEFKIFDDLYESCMEVIREKSVVVTKPAPYVPHNYNYLSEKEKDDIANKYQMTREEFETTHVNVSSENYLFPKESEGILPKHVDSSESDESIESSESSSSDLDPDVKSILSNY